MCPLDGGVLCGSVLLRHDVDDLAPTPGAELDRTSRDGEQRVVAAATDIGARVEAGPALTHQDLAGVDQLTAEPLHAEPLGLGVTPVLRGRGALLRCHGTTGPLAYFVLMSVTLTCVYCCRCPSRRRYPVLFLNLTMSSVGPLAAPRISAVTLTLASDAGSEVTVWPSTISTAGKVRLAPTSPATWSTEMTSPTLTFCWLLPLRTMAYTEDSLSRSGSGRTARPHASVREPAPVTAPTL